MKNRTRWMAGSISLALVAASAIVVAGQRPQTPGADAAALTARLNALDARVHAEEGIRAVKRLQNAYAHFIELGLWDDAAALFSDGGTAYFGATPVTGREQIRQRMLRDHGGHTGLADGELNTHLVLAPVVTMDPDGKVIRGRWHVFGMVGSFGRSQAWEGGIFENEFVEENGRWKIRTLHEYPQFTGNYEDNGWKETSDAAPFHYDPARAGTPVPNLPPPPSSKPLSAFEIKTRTTALQQRIEQLDDEAAVTNLQNSYGFYLDRKMWDDIADLFTADATLEIDNHGVYVGPSGVRRAMEQQFGPAGLKDGQINDHLQLETYVSVVPSVESARARGFELRMLGVNNQSAEWGQGIFENRYRKDNGVWKIQDMHVYPRLVADYEKGWKEARGLPAVTGTERPDRPSSGPSAVYPEQMFVPFHFDNPGTGAAVQRVGISQATLTVRRDVPKIISDYFGTTDDLIFWNARLDEIDQRLARAIAYDATENISTAYGYYIDGFEWDNMADLFSRDGWKELSYIGTYVGRERIRQSVKMRYGNRNGRTRGGSFAMHQKTQPVIHVSADGKSAKIRLRLLQLGGNTWLTGVYENQTVNEDGVFKISAMDLDYVWLASYHPGWGKVAEGDSRRFAPTTPPALAPDRPLRGVQFAPFPKIAETGFHYKNPVSGREPPLLLP
jgi:hypothetical protein